MLSNRRVREENLRFQKLYSLTNEQLFEYSMGTDTLIMSNPSGLRTWWTSKRESCPRTGRTTSSTTPTLDSGEIRP